MWGGGEGGIVKQEWLLAFWNMIQTHERLEGALLLQNKTCSFWGNPLFEATEQQLNVEKWDVGYLSAFGWAVL